MAIYHCSVKGISRGVGRSATAAAAYRSGDRIVDERTGEIHDYRKRSGVEHAELVLPEGVTITREELWNAAEQAEKRKDAKVAREWNLALPDELDHQQRIELARSFALKLVNRYGVAADVCIHSPGRDGDQRNHHAHILTTTRICDGVQFHEHKKQSCPEHLQGRSRNDLHGMSLSSLAADGGRQIAGVLYAPARFHGFSFEGLRRPSQREKIRLTQKTRVLDSPKTSGKEIESVRELWAGMANEALKLAGHSERIDHRTLEAQGIDTEPTKHLGPIVTQMERKGIRTDRGSHNRAVMELREAQRELAEAKEQEQGVAQARDKAKAWRERQAAEKLAQRMKSLEAERRKREAELAVEAERQKQHQEQVAEHIQALRKRREQQGLDDSRDFER